MHCIQIIAKNKFYSTIHLLTMKVWLLSVNKYFSLVNNSTTFIVRRCMGDLSRISLPWCSCSTWYTGWGFEPTSSEFKSWNVFFLFSVFLLQNGGWLRQTLSHLVSQVDQGEVSSHVWNPAELTRSHASRLRTHDHKFGPQHSTTKL